MTFFVVFDCICGQHDHNKQISFIDPKFQEFHLKHFQDFKDAFRSRLLQVFLLEFGISEILSTAHPAISFRILPEFFYLISPEILFRLFVLDCLSRFLKELLSGFSQEFPPGFIQKILFRFQKFPYGFLQEFYSGILHKFYPGFIQKIFLKFLPHSSRNFHSYSFKSFFWNSSRNVFKVSYSSFRDFSKSYPRDSSMSRNYLSFPRNSSRYLSGNPF